MSGQAPPSLDAGQELGNDLLGFHPVGGRWPGDVAGAEGPTGTHQPGHSVMAELAIPDDIRLRRTLLPGAARRRSRARATDHGREPSVPPVWRRRCPHSRMGRARWVRVGRADWSRPC